MNNDIKKDVLLLWNWLAVKDKLEPSDVIFLFGAPSLDTPKKGAELFHKGLAPYIVCTGYSPTAEKNPFGSTFANVFYNELIKLDVPKERIIVQNKSTNTPEDVKMTMPIIRKNNIKCQKIILVASTFHQRRACATFKRIEPKIEIINCPRIVVDESLKNVDSSRYGIIGSILMEYEKLKIYGEKGDLVLQPPPKKVQDSYHILKLSNR